MSNPGCFVKGEKRPKQGRPKGCKNKVTQTALEAIALAADRLGGADRLFKWAKEDQTNERAFWTTIYPKLLPLQVTGANGGDMRLIHRIEAVIVDPANPYC